MRKQSWAVLCVMVIATGVAASWADRLGRLAERRAERMPTVRASMRAPSTSATAPLPIELRGSPAKSTPISLQLSGAIDPLGADATPTSVIVRAGSQSFPAVLTGSRFAVSLSRVAKQGQVSIEVTTPRVQYRALLGSAELLKRQAGADGILDDAENPTLQVSPLTTSIYFFLTRELGGRLPASDDEMDRALLAINTDDLGPATEMLRATTQGEVPLTAGFANGYALLSDRDAYRNFLIRNTAIRNNSGAYVQQAKVAGFTSADLARDWVMVNGRQLIDAPSYILPGIQMLLRRQDGYDVSTSRGRPNSAASTSVNASEDLILTPQAPMYIDQLALKQVVVGAPSIRVVERATISRDTYRRLAIGKRWQLWLQIREQTVGYPQYPDLATRDELRLSYLRVGAFEDVRLPVTANDVLGRRGLPWFCAKSTGVTGEADVLGNCQYAIHMVGAGGTGVVDGLGDKIDTSMNPIAAPGGTGFQWRIAADGSFQIDGPGYRASFWRLGIADAASDAMFFLATSRGTDTPQVLSGYTNVINGNDPAAFGPSEPVGTWAFGTLDYGNVYAYDDFFVYAADHFVRMPDNTVEQVSRFWGTSTLTAPPDYQQIARSGWKLIGLDLYDTRYRANTSTGLPDTLYFSSCEQARLRGATQCAPYRVRVFRPLTRVGNRWYGIQDLYTRYDNNNYLPPFPFERQSIPTWQALQSP